MARYLIPLGVFLALAVLLAIGLRLDPREVPSPLIGKPAPAFSLPSVEHPEHVLAHDDLKGKVYLFNVWASWCVSCRAEQPVMVALARTHEVEIYGLNYKDTREDARRWLATFGDPYVDSAFDADGRTGIEWGVYGVPETFVVDRDGIIRYKHIGPVTQEALDDKILPIVRRLQGSAG